MTKETADVNWFDVGFSIITIGIMFLLVMLIIKVIKVIKKS